MGKGFIEEKLPPPITPHPRFLLSQRKVPHIPLSEVVQDLSVENFDRKLVFRWKAKSEVSYRLEKATSLDLDTWIRLDEVEIEINENRATAIFS